MPPSSSVIGIKLSKTNVPCPICLKEGQQVKPGKVEFRHIDPQTKEESISKLVYGNLVFPDPYTAIKVYVEFGKCVPLCKVHHKELHRAEERGDSATLSARFNLSEDEFYQNQIEAFKLLVSRTLPSSIHQQLTV